MNYERGLLQKSSLQRHRQGQPGQLLSFLNKQALPLHEESEGTVLATFGIGYTLLQQSIYEIDGKANKKTAAAMLSKLAQLHPYLANGNIETGYWWGKALLAVGLSAEGKRTLEMYAQAYINNYRQPSPLHICPEKEEIAHRLTHLQDMIVNALGRKSEVIETLTEQLANPVWE